VVSNLEPVALPADHELTIYRVVQEALTNTAKYANATPITVLASTSLRVRPSVTGWWACAIACTRCMAR